MHLFSLEFFIHFNQSAAFITRSDRCFMLVFIMYTILLLSNMSILKQMNKIRIVLDKAF